MITFPKLLTLSKQASDRVFYGTGAPWKVSKTMPEGPGLAEMEKILEILPPLSMKHGPWLAGGAVRRLLQGRSIADGDMDFFFTSKAEWQKFFNALQGFEVVHKSDAAITYMVDGIKVQFIKRLFYDNLDKLFGDFDFTACQVATDGKSIAYGPDSVGDIAANVLRFATVGRITKKTVMGRFLKYLNHGFMPSEEVFSKMVEHGLKGNTNYDIWNAGIERPSANYDHEAKVDECMEAKVFRHDAMQAACDNLGMVADQPAKESLKRFILNNSVASKLADMPLVGEHEGRKFVFIHGFPMSLRGFYLMATKAVFGGTVRISGKRWAELHAETQLLCQGLNVELQKGREAFSVLRGIKTAMKWTDRNSDREVLVQWVKDVEEKINRMGE